MIIVMKILRQKLAVNDHGGVLDGIHEVKAGSDFFVSGGEFFAANKLTGNIDGVALTANNNGFGVLEKVVDLFL